MKILVTFYQNSIFQPLVSHENILINQGLGVPWWFDGAHNTQGLLPFDCG
jgi:hypothetical protein